MQEFFNQVLFSIAGYDITLASVLFISLLAGAFVLIWQLLNRRIFPRYFAGDDMLAQRKKLRRLVLGAFLILFIITLQLSIGLDVELYNNERITITLVNLFQALLLWQTARLTDFVLSILLNKRLQREQAQKAQKEGLEPKGREKTQRVSGTRLVQYIVYLIAILFILNAVLNLNFEVLPIKTGEDGEKISITLAEIFYFVLVLLIARLIIWILTNLILPGYYKNREVDIGSQYAINQLLKYVIYTIGLIVAIESLGVNLTLIWGGAAALLVGVGLGLQQTFNDLFSGIILLTERSVQVGDVVDLQGLVGTVKRIGIRTSEVQTRQNIVVIVPNSKLIVDNVVNWSHNDRKARFWVTVGVAYGSDTTLVKELLLKAARSHKKVLGYPPPFVRFTDFGNSSLDFELHFFSREFMLIENVMSDLRFEIDRLFREHEVTIPFPQQDVWFKNALDMQANNGPARDSQEQRIHRDTD
jgi:small-conductance mechanosensitive channel